MTIEKFSDDGITFGANPLFTPRAEDFFLFNMTCFFATPKTNFGISAFWHFGVSRFSSLFVSQ